MADVKKARIFLRRGNDATRINTELCEGELGYSTDGTRVFVGNGADLGGNVVGSTTFFLSAGRLVTELSAASADGRGEIGDLAFVSASAYALSAINPAVSADNVLKATVVNVDSSIGSFYALSARSSVDSNANLTWVNVNSGIPVHYINIPDYSIPAAKIYGGSIGGNLSTTGQLTAGSNLYLPHVKNNAQNSGSLTDNVVYPLGITSTNQVTALSSYSQLGASTGTLILSAAPSGSSAIIINHQGSAQNATVQGASTAVTTYNGFTGDGYAGSLPVTYYTYTIDRDDINVAIDSATVGGIDWAEIDEFHFQTYMEYTSAGTGFIGYKNEASNNRKVILDYTPGFPADSTTKIKGIYHVVPNAYTSTENLTVYVGTTTSSPSDVKVFMRLVCIKRK